MHHDVRNLSAGREGDGWRRKQTVSLPRTVALGDRRSPTIWSRSQRTRPCVPADLMLLMQGAKVSEHRNRRDTYQKVISGLLPVLGSVPFSSLSWTQQMCSLIVFSWFPLGNQLENVPLRTTLCSFLGSAPWLFLHQLTYAGSPRSSQEKNNENRNEQRQEGEARTPCARWAHRDMNENTRAEDETPKREDEEKRFATTCGDAEPGCAGGAGQVWQKDSSRPVSNLRRANEEDHLTRDSSE